MTGKQIAREIVKEIKKDPECIKKAISNWRGSDLSWGCAGRKIYKTSKEEIMNTK
jgi:hypothetical protein